MGKKIAGIVIAAAKAKAAPKPIKPAAAKRLAALKPFSRPRPPTKLVTGGMPRAPPRAAVPRDAQAAPPTADTAGIA